jgi:chemotaxis response regulator CheB
MHDFVSSYELTNVKLVIASSIIRQRISMQKVLEQNGIRVVANEPLTDILISKLDVLNPDVVLLDIGNQTDGEHEVMERLLDEYHKPVIFNDSSGLASNEPVYMEKWYSKLLQKIADATGKIEFEGLDINLNWVNEESSQELIQPVSQDMLARNIWVLGASLGGPEALKQFFGAIPEDLNVTFILVQHLGNSFLGLLAEQLNRISSFDVKPARVGHLVRHKEVLVVPVNQRLQISPLGKVELHSMEEKTRYSPSIDGVMCDMSDRYGEHCNAIIFSGMCTDAVIGAVKIHQAGGQVWTQDERSCVIFEMPETVKKTGVTTFTGTPIQLAHHLVAYYK